MKEGTPSRTAAWVAAMRGLAPLLPRDARLADDAYGLRFAGRRVASLRRAALKHPTLAQLAAAGFAPALRDAFWMQVRTRAIDEVMLDFTRASGRQLLLLGAGYDARAWRFSQELGDATVFEVDHPATQARKQRVLADAGFPPARVRFLPWNFEGQPTEELPAALHQLGHDPATRTLTIWEGVISYLTGKAVDASVRTVRRLSAPGSLLVFTYGDGSTTRRSGGRLTLFLAKSLGEPFRFHFDPQDLPGWLRERGFSLQSDHTLTELAARLLPPRYADRFRAAAGRHIAVARAA